MTYVKICDAIYVEDWIKMIGVTEDGKVVIWTGDGGCGTFGPEDDAYADARALYEHRLAAATGGEQP